MTFYEKRDKFSKLSIKIGIVFSKVGLSPNQWTLVSIVPVLAAVYFLMLQDFLVAALLFIISAFLDMVDGSVARVTGRVTKFGAYLDTVIDRYVEVLIIFGLLFAGLPGLPLFGLNTPVYAWIFVYLFGSLMTTYAKAAAKEKGLVPFGTELKGGLLERAERLIILFVGILLASLDPVYLTYVLVLLAVLTNISAVQRIWKAYRMSR